MPIYPTATNKPYRIKRTDSAASVPNRVTFPQGTYVTAQLPDVRPPSMSWGAPTSTFFGGNPYAPNVRLPYAMSPGTQASGLAGNQGATSAMYPTTSYGQTQAANWLSQNRPLYNPNPTFNNVGTSSFLSGSGANLASYWNQNVYGIGRPTDLPESSGAPLANTSQMKGTGLPGTPGTPGNAAASVLMPGQYVNASGDVARGATPFGTNAAGERLDVNGNVWDPETATRDIYGGKFIQVGQTRWERNRHGRLVKVQYGKGGTKRIINGGKNQSARRKRLAANQNQQAEVPNTTATAFVSFRA